MLGARHIGVTCEHCGCEYYYELFRVGIGEATTPTFGEGAMHFAIGAKAANVRSQKRASKDLDKRLSRDAELVPCPKCHWINEELVRGYRRGRYRQLVIWGPPIALVGVFASLLCAYLLSLNPGRDEIAVPYFLYVGPAIFVALRVAMIVARRWLQSQIQPNCEFPRPPQLPPGTPNALMKNADGEFQIIERQYDQPVQTHEWHEHVLGRDRLPSNCCDCLRPVTEISTAYPLAMSNAVRLNIPRCTECSRQSARDARRVLWIAILLSSVSGGALCTIAFLLFVNDGPLNLHEFVYLYLALWVVSLLFAVPFSVIFASRFTAPARYRSLDLSRGFMRLWFRNPEYGTLLITRKGGR